MGLAVASRRGRIRISPHVYNDADDLGRLRDALHSAAAGAKATFARTAP
jgi:selenocysteine lyase/cysteine desulfurase